MFFDGRFRRVIAWLLVVVMIFPLATPTILAADTGESGAQYEQETNEDSEDSAITESTTELITENYTYVEEDTEISVSESNASGSENNTGSAGTESSANSNSSNNSENSSTTEVNSEASEIENGGVLEESGEIPFEEESESESEPNGTESVEGVAEDGTSLEVVFETQMTENGLSTEMETSLTIGTEEESGTKTVDASEVESESAQGIGSSYETETDTQETGIAVIAEGSDTETEEASGEYDTEESNYGIMLMSVEDTESTESATESPTTGAAIIESLSVSDTSTVSNMYVWIYSNTSTKVLGYSDFTNNGDSNPGISDALSYTSSLDNVLYYLVPIDYFLTAFGDYGYSFDVDECPFIYAPNAGNASYANGVQAYYVAVVGSDSSVSYYVRIQDTYATGYPRSNIYYTKDYVYSEIDDTVSPSGTVINVFDYWVLSENEDDSVRNYDTATFLNSGINSGHTLKFAKNPAAWYSLSKYNAWTRSAQVYQGIVQSVLVDGYPALNNDVTGSSESLDYLFNPKTDNDSRTSYTNVSGLLQIDDVGYYYYDSTKNYAEYDSSDNSFNVYNTWKVTSSGGVKGQFFPFNSFDSVEQSTSSTSSTLNHYFGLSLTTRFVQQYGGHTSSSQTTETTFEFSGDDDVWIFIDDVLVADLGGIHSPASVVINFSTGEVVINEGTSYEITSSLYEAFYNAGKVTIEEWEEITVNGSTTYRFKDNTYHTLKFYYLERGNDASNLSLKYNLIEIPETSIYKVNQYGDPVEGAVFAVYEAEVGQALADGEYIYYYVLDSGAGIAADGVNIFASGDNIIELATSVSSKLEDGTYLYELDSGGDRTGNITDSAGNVILTAKYIGTTDSEGQVIFKDEYGCAYTIRELKDLFGSDYFIMREIVVPDGYRLISEEIYMEIINSYSDDSLLKCNNTFTSGVYSLPAEMVTATDTLYYSRDGTTYSVLYNDIENKEVNGTLFAVVLKYTGDAMDSSTAASYMSIGSNWTPLYGDDEVGYTLSDIDYGSAGYDESVFIEAAIEAAINQSAYSDVIFTTASGTGAMQLTLTCLPGDIETYYFMLEDNEKYKTQYAIAYYYTTADSLSNADYSNTYRVISDSFKNATVVDTNDNNATKTVDYYGFSRLFGATIMVPNLMNRFFVQKLDEDGNYVNDAVFAMYDVSEVTDQTSSGSTIYYKAHEVLSGSKTSDEVTLIYLGEDDDGDNIGYAVVGESSSLTDNTLKTALASKTVTYEIDSDTGVITVTDSNTGKTYTITPLEVRTTVSATDSDNPSKEEGTAYFNGFSEGTYYVREIYAPPGYKLNTTEVMVLVTDEAVYGNAGTDDDGVTVARGAGYLVDSLDRFASEGEIDRTLSWIYANLRLNTNDIDTFDFGDPYDYTETDWFYASSTKDSTEKMVTYLEYDVDHETVLFNYVENDNRDVAYKEDTRRLFTDEGWAAIEIYQDYEYYKELLAAAGNEGLLYSYSEISHSITHLFSRSLYIRVTDEEETYDLNFMKVDGFTLDVDESAGAEQGTLESNTGYTTLDGVEFMIYKWEVLTDGDGNVILDNSGELQYVWNTYYTTRKVQAAYTAGVDQTEKISDSGAVVLDTKGDPIMLDLYVQTTDENGNYIYTKISDMTSNELAELSTDTLLYVLRTDSSGTAITDEYGNSLYDPVYELETDSITGDLVTDSEGNYVFVTEESAAYISGSGGTSGLVTFSDLPVGTYKIVETSGIEGYYNYGWSWIVTITMDEDTGDPEITITSDTNTVSVGSAGELSTWYKYTGFTEASTYNTSEEYLESLTWYTDAYEGTQTVSGTPSVVDGSYVIYYYWPNYYSYDFEFLKVDGDTLEVSSADPSVLTAYDVYTALSGVEFTLYRQELVVDSNGDPVLDSGGNEQYEWVEFYYTTRYVQETDSDGHLVYDADDEPVYVQATDENDEPIYDDDGNPVYVTVGVSTYITGADGAVKFEDLPVGTYKIEETDKADGYSQGAWYWLVNIDMKDTGSGVMAIEVTVTPSMDATTSSGQPTLYTYTVTQNDGSGYDVGTVLYYWPNYLIQYQLPSTGRGSVPWMMVCGVLVMCISTGFYLHGESSPGSKRRRRCRHGCRSE